MRKLPITIAALVLSAALCVGVAFSQNVTLITPSIGNPFTGAFFQFGSGSGTPSHIATGQTTAPALTSCGSSPAITGSDTAGTVTVKTTTCTITFNVAYSAAPFCLVVDETTPSTSMAYTVTTAHIAISAGLTSNDLVQYVCLAQNGG